MPKKDTLSFTDAAEQLLRTAGKPLSYTELTKRALGQRLVQTESETPAVSMHVSLRSEMKRRAERGEAQRFTFLGEGMFGLVDFLGKATQKTKSALDQVRESRAEASNALYTKLVEKNNGANFETMIADLLVALGYQDVKVIGGKDDQGVDIICEKRDGIVKVRIAIQCKCKNLTSQIGPKDISTLRDNLSTYQCQHGIVVTTTTLNDAAKAKAKEAGKEPISFIEHDELLDLLAEKSIGIRSESLRYHQLDVSQYDFLN